MSSREQGPWNKVHINVVLEQGNLHAPVASTVRGYAMLRLRV